MDHQTDLLIACLLVAMFATFAFFRHRINLRIQLVSVIVLTAYMAVELLRHPESKGYFILFVGLASMLRIINKMKDAPGA